MLTAAPFLLIAQLVAKAESASDRHPQESVKETQPSAEPHEKKSDGTRLHYDLNLHKDNRGNRLRLEVPLEAPPTEAERSRQTLERSRDIAPKVPESPEAPQSPDTP
jgi:hypothetical protein